MVNLRSGRMPDLSRGYVPPRAGSANTYDDGSLYVPQRTAKRTKSVSNDEFEDPVEGIEMSDNVGGPSGQGSGHDDSVSEETHMKLEITRLQPEVERMRDSRGEPSTEEKSSDEHTSMNMRRFSLNLISQCLEIIYLSAYALWSVIKDNFSERPAVRRTRLFEELVGMTAKSKGSVKAFIKCLIAIGTECARIGYQVQDFMHFDRLLTGVSKEWASFIRYSAGEPPKMNMKTPVNNAQDSLKKNKSARTSTSSLRQEAEMQSKHAITARKLATYTLNGKNKDKDKDGTGSTPVQNIVERYSAQTEKAYSSGQTGGETGSYTAVRELTPHLAKRSSRLSLKRSPPVTSEMADGTTVPATAVAAAVEKVDIPSEGAKIPLSDLRMDTSTICTNHQNSEASDEIFHLCCG
ncbi:hypothetical protein PAAG_03103 [Paracoccidioides lutzii Pb01]|uniref:Uncharacterized protein n=1 Tax=Paracoccidioides lutzii (strain ATCC MYA-826 / Pb01) TaxID=502779 RepID=C1GYE9_PARBA|nr:hypothetical protein PAAG_03103 [Paracoccidioides lutzii Pb01]EEH41540.2 hypothetical protein PAAG_03103 [Paracoccidioides lutzii Pb01]